LYFGPFLNGKVGFFRYLLPWQPDVLRALPLKLGPTVSQEATLDFCQYSTRASMSALAGPGQARRGLSGWKVRTF